MTLLHLPQSGAELVFSWKSYDGLRYATSSSSERNLPSAPGEVVCLSLCVSPQPRAASYDARENKPESDSWGSAGYISGGLRNSTRKEYKEYGHRCNYDSQASHLEMSSTAVAAHLPWHHRGPPGRILVLSCLWLEFDIFF